MTDSDFSFVTAFVNLANKKTYGRCWGCGTIMFCFPDCRARKYAPERYLEPRIS